MLHGWRSAGQTMVRNKLIRPCELADLSHLAANIRPEDEAEVMAAVGMTIPAALSMGFAYSPWVGVSPFTSNPVTIFGVVPSSDHPGAGLVWMLATTELKDVQMTFLRRNREFMPVLHKDYPLLYNYVDARNKLHIKWLKWLDFKFIRLVPEYGVGRLPFYEIARINSCALPQQ